MPAGGARNSPAVLWRSRAPQSDYSDHLLQTRAIDGPIGYKLEAPPDGVLKHLAKRLDGRAVTLA